MTLFETPKGKFLAVYSYKNISIARHNCHVISAHLLCFSLMLGGIYREFPLGFFLIIGLPYLITNIEWSNRLRKENSRPSYKVYENGLEIFSNGQKCFKKWPDIKNISFLAPWQELDNRPGFKICFNDGTSWMVYQVIEGYGNFYQYFKFRDIDGVEDRLPIYNRLNIYGQSIDGGDLTSENNMGKPARYI